jgi:hypothetical protein
VGLARVLRGLRSRSLGGTRVVVIDIILVYQYISLVGKTEKSGITQPCLGSTSWSRQRF